ncbi:MAG: hypothetical protein HZB62_06890 [Nitrospirae bacterium]|nr:hypothetical protein [Nitrospirota bacterium]
MKRNKTLFFAVPLMLILVFMVAYKYGYQGIRTDKASVKEEQEIKLKLMQKYMALIAEKPMIEKQISLLKTESKSDASKLIEGQTPSLAAATLQEIVTGIVVEKGGAISSQRVGRPEDLGKYKVITVSLDAVMPDTHVLSEILYSIETRTPYLVVKELETRVKNPISPKDLLVKIDISALTGAK